MEFNNSVVWLLEILDKFAVTLSMMTDKYDNVNYWVGGTDLEAEGTYLWVSTRDPFSYTDWHPSQPNGGPEDCVAFNCFTDSSIQWHDFQCSHMNYYICEKEWVLDEYSLGVL